MLARRAPSSFNRLARDVSAIDRSRRTKKSKAAQPNDIVLIHDLVLAARAKGNCTSEQASRLDDLLDRRVKLSDSLIAKLREAAGA